MECLPSTRRGRGVHVLHTQPQDSDGALPKRPPAFDFCVRFGYNVLRILKEVKEQDDIG
jgi:hypothetical protein